MKNRAITIRNKSFLNAIEGKDEHIVKAQQAVNVSKIAEAALLSSQKGVQYT